jgi:hypothetical protein
MRHKTYEYRVGYKEFIHYSRLQVNLIGNQLLSVINDFTAGRLSSKYIVLIL